MYQDIILSEIINLNLLNYKNYKFISIIYYMMIKEINPLMNIIENPINEKVEKPKEQSKEDDPVALCCGSCCCGYIIFTMILSCLGST